VTAQEESGKKSREWQRATSDNLGQRTRIKLLVRNRAAGEVAFLLEKAFYLSISRARTRVRFLPEFVA
jgi:hypothetical protein